MCACCFRWMHRLTLNDKPYYCDINCEQLAKLRADRENALYGSLAGNLPGLRLNQL